jgi:hypothetical protein
LVFPSMANCFYCLIGKTGKGSRVKRDFLMKISFKK